MVRVRHLPKAPIREALIDVRVDLPTEFRATVFRNLNQKVGGEYGKVTEMSQQETTVEFNAGALTAKSLELGLHGVNYESEKLTAVAQFRRDGFTYNKLRPYSAWETIFPEAMRLWNVFLEAARPFGVRQASVRYINEFTVPAPVSSLQAYLQSVPATPLGAPGSPRSFLSRVVTEDSGRGIATVVTYSVNEQPGARLSNIVLDVDVVCRSVRGVRAEELTATLGALHEIKNQIFFEALTDLTLAQFA